MAENTENRRPEGESGQRIEIGESSQRIEIGESGQRIEVDNMEILMKSMAEMRQHQQLLEERLGILPPRHNSGSTGQTSNQGDLIMPARNQNLLGQWLQQYVKLSAEEFNGSPPNPEKAEEWLQYAEHVLEHLTEDRDMWVKLSTYRFRGPALDWWKAVMRAGGEVMTWNRFKGLFMDKYVPDAARDRKFYEFMFLTKGDMSVSAYNDKFIRLSHYGKNLVDTDEAKAKKFIRGSDPEMRKQLSCLRIRTYEDALNRSLDYEEEMGRYIYDPDARSISLSAAGSSHGYY